MSRQGGAFDLGRATQLAQEDAGRGSMLMVEGSANCAEHITAMSTVGGFMLRKLLAHGDCPILTWMVKQLLQQSWMTSDTTSIQTKSGREQSRRRVGLIMALIGHVVSQDALDSRI